MYVYLKDTSLSTNCEVAGCYFSDHDKIMLYLDKYKMHNQQQTQDIEQ